MKQTNPINIGRPSPVVHFIKAHCDRFCFALASIAFAFSASSLGLIVRSPILSWLGVIVVLHAVAYILFSFSMVCECGKLVQVARTFTKSTVSPGIRVLSLAVLVIAVLVIPVGCFAVVSTPIQVRNLLLTIMTTAFALLGIGILWLSRKLQ